MTDMWESVAGAWERNADYVDHHMAAATERLLDAARIGADSAVLEVACGPGGAGIAAADRGARVVFCDAAPSMVAAAGRRAGGAETFVCDQTALEAPDAHFDAVISRHGLMFVVPPETAVREAVRVLVAGGRYGAIVWDARGSNPWLGVIFDAIGEQFGVEFPPPHIPGPFALGDPDRLAAALTAGGLEDVSVERLSTPLESESIDAWWGRVPEIAGPVAQALAGMEPDVRDAIRDRALAAAEAEATRTDDGIEFGGSVLIGSGAKR
jgi:SAM-dependent methyltransferase